MEQRSYFTDTLYNFEPTSYNHKYNVILFYAISQGVHCTLDFILIRCQKNNFLRIANVSKKKRTFLDTLGNLSTRKCSLRFSHNI